MKSDSVVPLKSRRDVTLADRTLTTPSEPRINARSVETVQTRKHSKPVTTSKELEAHRAGVVPGVSSARAIVDDLNCVSEHVRGSSRVLSARDASKSTISIELRPNEAVELARRSAHSRAEIREHLREKRLARPTRDARPTVSARLGLLSGHPVPHKLLNKSRDGHHGLTSRLPRRHGVEDVSWLARSVVVGGWGGPRLRAFASQFASKALVLLCHQSSRTQVIVFAERITTTVLLGLKSAGKLFVRNQCWRGEWLQTRSSKNIGEA
mmetsp:Transcript_12639/g.34982  ORF Transcript_12639/g.34982 Transcript_12639/m.34982 type:complete len:267 (+) Transcript_12639:157-957(+)